MRPMELRASPQVKRYQYQRSGESPDGKYTWRNKDLFFYRDFDKEQVVDVEEMLGNNAPMHLLLAALLSISPVLLAH